MQNAKSDRAKRKKNANLPIGSQLTYATNGLLFQQPRESGQRSTRKRRDSLTGSATRNEKGQTKKKLT